MRARCSNPACTFTNDIGVRVGGKALFGGLGLLGVNQVRDPIAKLALGIGSILLGHWIDQKIQDRCPTCGWLLTMLT